MMMMTFASLSDYRILNLLFATLSIPPTWRRDFMLSSMSLLHLMHRSGAVTNSEDMVFSLRVCSRNCSSGNVQTTAEKK